MTQNIRERLPEFRQDLGKPIDGRISQANGRLKSANAGISIERHGQRLWLRATFPPRPNSNKTRPHQQRMTLNLRANPEGLKQAEARAREISGLLAAGRFTWALYGADNAPDSQTCADWVSQFEDRYYASGGSETTWAGDYWKIYKRLPAGEPLTAPLVEKTILSTEPNTKTRKRACMALKALCDFAKLDYEPAPLAGNYGPSQVNPRDLPSDALIVECYRRIQNPAWRWIYGVMATFGLRNHEAFRLDYARLQAGDRVVAILDNTKTGYHEAWAFYPEWFDEFDLQNVYLPNVDITRSNSSVGHSVTQYFKTVGIPFSPYNLRHAWAVRTLNFNLPYELAAMQQGHSAEVHKRTYHRWIKGDIHQRFYELITSRQDRPRPPATERGLSSTAAQPVEHGTDS